MGLLSFLRGPCVVCAPSAPLGDLEALEAGYLVEYPIRELTFRLSSPRSLSALRAALCSANSSRR